VVQHEEDAVDSDNWFNTGDVATIDPFGHMQITDRSKDVIKSGGEWISSIEVENIAVSHPKVMDSNTPTMFCSAVPCACVCFLRGLHLIIRDLFCLVLLSKL